MTRTPGFKARYPTTCPRCDRPINTGDPVVLSRHRVVIHVECSSGHDDEPDMRPSTKWRQGK